MKIKLIKPWRKYQIGETIDVNPTAYKALLDRHIGIVVRETKEEKKAYKRRTKKTEN